MNGYFWNRILAPIVLVVIPLAIGILLIVQTQSKFLTYVGYILHTWAVVALIALRKILFLMRKVEANSNGLILEGKIIRWEDIFEFNIPWSRWYINVRYKKDDVDGYFIIANPYTFKDLFRSDFRTENFDKLYEHWQEKRHDINVIVSDTGLRIP